ncbi:MAG: hypothetical protein H6719_04320 [Sandaracinaceae bacterium]|nr:hypothetical protein [Sandaracinaceae bacterium]
MNERLSFLLILGVGAFGVACDGGGGDGDDAGPCPMGTICLDAGDSTDDGGGTPDGARPDAGPPAACGTVGQEGGHCRGGTMCLTGLTCAEEISVLPMGGATLTLGNAFGIPTGTEDPAHEGECIPGADSTVPIPFFPMGGLCTQACDPAADGTCGECASCSTALGGSDSFAAVGITVRSGTDLTSDARPGLCQLNCAWDGTTNGGCPVGYACDPGSNICQQACQTDSQCRTDWLLSEAIGLCEVQSGTATCNSATGLCEVAGDSSSAFGSECETSDDCPPDLGICLIGGRCSTYQCSSPDGMSAGASTCPADSACVGIGGNGGSLCLGLCDTPADCFDGVACSPATGLPDGRAGLCSPICEADSECHGGERCLKGRFSDPDLGFCANYCIPEGGAADPMATACETDQFCNPVMGTSYGFCRALDQLCSDDTDCVGDQACFVRDANLYGRCVDGCATTADCTGMEECVIFDDGDAMTPASTHGICRAPGGACSASPTFSDGTIRQPMLGDAQCISTQECSQTMATDPASTGTCQDR